MNYVKQTTGDRNVKILAFLFASREWANIREIAEQTKTTQNLDRLKRSLTTLVERNIIENWEKLSESQKIDAQKLQTKEIRGKNNYKLTDKGRSKFMKIQESCLDPDIRVILRMKSATSEND